MVDTNNKAASVKLPKEGLLLSGDKIFRTLQAEGVSIGRSAVFIRLHMCNLACKFKDGSICDAWYTWDKSSSEYYTEPEIYSYERVISEISKFKPSLLVITGGEPLLQQVNILGFLNTFRNLHPAESSKLEIEIETNGTIVPSYELMNNYNVRLNCSPKLSNSGNSYRRGVKPESINVIRDQEHSIFKFVVSDDQDIEEVSKFVTEFRIPSSSVMLMPEGVSVEILNQKMLRIAEVCIEKNWRLTPRLQFYIWGNVRGT